MSMPTGSRTSYSELDRPRDYLAIWTRRLLPTTVAGHRRGRKVADLLRVTEHSAGKEVKVDSIFDRGGRLQRPRWRLKSPPYNASSQGYRPI